MNRQIARLSLLILPLLLTACAVQHRGLTVPLVRLSEVAPNIEQSVRYASSDNFVGEPITGYNAPTILLTREAAEALAEAQTNAEALGLSLLVFDGYRPQRAVNHFVDWSKDLDDIRNKADYYPDVPKSELFERGYIAERSGHSRGSTVDLTLTRAGRQLNMGTPFDYFGARSHTEYPAIEAEALANRILLRTLMEMAGFRNYPKEWWHYTLRDEPFADTYFDVPVE